MCCRIILSKYQATPLARRQRQASGLRPSLAHAGPHPLIPLIYQAHRVRRSVRYAAVFPPPGCPAPGRRSKPPSGHRFATAFASMAWHRFARDRRLSGC